MCCSAFSGCGLESWQGRLLWSTKKWCVRLLISSFAYLASVPLSCCLENSVTGKDSAFTKTHRCDRFGELFAVNNRIQRRYSRFFTISSQRREQSQTRTLKWPKRNRVQITCNISRAYHVQHVVLRATWCEGTAQLLSLTELKSHLFERYFVG